MTGNTLGFNGDQFCCRLCGAKSKIDPKNPDLYNIQQNDVEPKLLQQEDIEGLSRENLDKIYRIKRRFLFDERLRYMNRFVCCPLDPLHDLPEV